MEGIQPASYQDLAGRIPACRGESFIKLNKKGGQDTDKKFLTAPLPRDSQANFVR